MLEEIRQKVNQKVQLKHKEIIIAAYQVFIFKHKYSIECKCNYCKLVESFLLTRKKLKRVENIIDNYYYLPYKALDSEYAYARDLELSIYNNKVERKEIKKLII